MSIGMPDHDREPAGGGNGGEDESSTERNGDDRHLHDDQKSRSLHSEEPEDDDRAADHVDADSPTKTQDLAKAGLAEFDPNDGQNS